MSRAANEGANGGARHDKHGKGHLPVPAIVTTWCSSSVLLSSAIRILVFPSATNSTSPPAASSAAAQHNARVVVVYHCTGRGTCQKEDPTGPAPALRPPSQHQQFLLDPGLDITATHCSDARPRAPAPHSVYATSLSMHAPYPVPCAVGY